MAKQIGGHCLYTHYYMHIIYFWLRKCPRARVVIPSSKMYRLSSNLESAIFLCSNVKISWFSERKVLCETDSF